LAAAGCLMAAPGTTALVVPPDGGDDVDYSSLDRIEFQRELVVTQQATKLAAEQEDLQTKLVATDEQLQLAKTRVGHLSDEIAHALATGGRMAVAEDDGEIADDTTVEISECIGPLQEALQSVLLTKLRSEDFRARLAEVHKFGHERTTCVVWWGNNHAGWLVRDTANSMDGIDFRALKKDASR